MPDREKVIYDIERCICHVPDACRDCSHYRHREVIGCMEELLTDALALLKEQEERGKEICKRICDFIRGSCSTDTEADKEYVCHVIQKIFIKGWQ